MKIPQGVKTSYPHSLLQAIIHMRFTAFFIEDMLYLFWDFIKLCPYFIEDIVGQKPT